MGVIKTNYGNDKVYVLLVELFWQNHFSRKNSRWCEEYVAGELPESDKLHLFLFSEVAQIDNNGYLKSLKTTTEAIVFAEK